MLLAVSYYPPRDGFEAPGREGPITELLLAALRKSSHILVKRTHVPGNILAAKRTCYDATLEDPCEFLMNTDRNFVKGGS